MELFFAGSKERYLFLIMNISGEGLSSSSLKREREKTSEQCMYVCMYVCMRECMMYVIDHCH